MTSFLTCLLESEGSIYFAAWEGGLQAYSLATSDLNTVVNNSLSLYGVAFDSATDKIYWCSSTDIFRGNRNGTASETLTPSLRKLPTLSPLSDSSNLNGLLLTLTF